MLDSVSNVRIYGKFDILHQSVMSAKILSPSNNAKKQKTVNLFLKEKNWAGILEPCQQIDCSNYWNRICFGYHKDSLCLLITVERPFWNG